jgi:predicted AAA+ superfamily ATPase
MEILTLWPLSQEEIEGGGPGRFIDSLFSSSPLAYTNGPINENRILARLLRGGYPEVNAIESDARRKAWFGSYITSILQRDVRDIAQIEELSLLPRLLTLLATRSTALLNFSDLSRISAIPQSTLKRYMSLLEATFLTHPLPAWSSNLGKRLLKSPKLLLTDTGVTAHLQGLDQDRLHNEPTLRGPLLEAFVVMELRKLSTWSNIQPQIYHYRTLTGQEVDILLEDQAGRVVGVEVKASATVRGEDFRTLRALSEILGKRFRRGIVLYTGSEAVSFGPSLHALPVDALWRLHQPTH